MFLSFSEGVSLQSAEPVPIEQCNALKETQPQTLCVDVEPACGKGEDVKCLGRADLDPALVKRATAKKRSYTRARRYKRS